jgi:TonB family protein
MSAMEQALSAALLHLVWQGLLVAFGLWMALFVLRKRSANTRYLTSCAALALLAALPVITACLTYAGPLAGAAPASMIRSIPRIVSAATASSGPPPSAWLRSLERWALPAWALGVLLFSLRLVWAAKQVSALRRGAQPPAAPALALIAGLAVRMRLARPVRVLISAIPDSPSVVGWLRPVVLLSAATILGLTPQQLEAVLAHELAHIWRYDHLVNMLQILVETLLFYHPAVWWTSAQIRREREMCCDDLAVATCGDALCYARALTKLERLRVMRPRLALGGTDGPLFYRIRRLIGDKGHEYGPSKLPGILALSLGLACLALNMQWARGQQQEARAPEPAAVESAALDDPGIRVDLGGAAVIHRAPVEYPDAALKAGVQGTVVVEVTLDASGMVSDAHVVSGPADLRRAALESVLQWHFTRDAAGHTRQVSIAFQAPPSSAAESSVEPASREQKQRFERALEAQVRAAKLAREEQAEALERKLQLLQNQQTLRERTDPAQAEAVGSEIAAMSAADAALAGKLRLLQKQLAERAHTDPAQAEAVQSAIAALAKRLAEADATLAQAQAPLRAGQSEFLAGELRLLQKQLAERAQTDPAQAEALRDQISAVEKRLLDAQTALESARAAARLAQSGVLEKELRLLQKQQAERSPTDAVQAEAMRSQIVALKKSLAGAQSVLERTGEGNALSGFMAGRKLKSIAILGVTEQLRCELLSQLPVHEGDTLSEDSLVRIEAAVKQFDRHLDLSLYAGADGEVQLRIAAPNSGAGEFRK